MKIIFVGFGCLLCGVLVVADDWNLSGRLMPPGVKYSTSDGRSADQDQKRNPSVSDLPAFGRAYHRVLQARRDLLEAVRLGDDHQIQRMTTLLTRLEADFRGCHSLPVGAEAVVHTVGFYGSPDDQVTVRVTDRSRPCVLVLSAYESLRWNVEVEEGVDVDLVILTGYNEQWPAEVPKDIPVIRRCHSVGDYGFGYGTDRDQLEHLFRWVEAQVRIPIFSHLGAYQSDGHPVVIGPENVDWRMQMLESINGSPVFDSATMSAKDARSAMERRRSNTSETEAEDFVE